jgi:hypothetical protein
VGSLEVFQQISVILAAQQTRPRPERFPLCMSRAPPQTALKLLSKMCCGGMKAYSSKLLTLSTKGRGSAV